VRQADDIDEGRKSEIAADFAEGVLELCSEMEAIAPEERNSNNNAAPQELPGVLSNEIITQQPRTLNSTAIGFLPSTRNRQGVHCVTLTDSANNCSALTT
jgi:hypothetical protein